MVCSVAGAQNSDKLYEQGKALYDKKNYAAAVAKLRPAAEKGHKKAQYRLGVCYDKGRGVEEDNTKAFQWYAKAAAQGHAKAQYQLGRCYKKGKGTKADMAKAIEYFTKSAKQGNAEAQMALAKCYLKGQGVAASKDKAKSWATKAIRDDEDGDEVLEELRKDAAAGDATAKQMLKLLGK